MIWANFFGEKTDFPDKSDFPDIPDRPDVPDIPDRPDGRAFEEAKKVTEAI